MTNKKTKTCAVIGCGISGIAAAIRMKSKGYDVTVYEANAFPGGKLSEEYNNGYRFDMGPSVFTMPEYVDELFKISNKNPRDYYQFKHLNPVYQYFFEDGTVLDSFHGKTAYADEMAKKTNDSKKTIEKYLTKTETIYELTDDVFLKNSLHKFKNFLTKQTAKGILNFGKIGAFDTMHNDNAKSFTDERLVQIFDRYATYNGSNPYEAPATLNVIPFLEIIKGAYYPKGGMFSITRSLVKLAQDIGIEIKFSSRVKEIIVENGKACGVKTEHEQLNYDVVISNMDVYNSYQKLIPSAKQPKTIHQPKSSSGIVFYWGIKHSFKQLRLHNILFSKNYKEEFDTIFHKKIVYNDPTIYINITSKETPTDAPDGCENWFTMVNVPNNSGQNWDELINELRESVIQKVNRILKTDIRPFIECEMIFEPRVIESRTSSAFGAIYGNASNN
ncbi:MAG: phytoene desaturase, partial [Bacteroidia bacterium]|nr:phytoene desaturase [Bacteroidia bacterium]